MPINADETYLKTWSKPKVVSFGLASYRRSSASIGGSMSV
jgi:hypothetical protein